MQKTHLHPHAALSRQPVTGVLFSFETQAGKIHIHTPHGGEEPSIYFYLPGLLTQPAEIVILSVCDFIEEVLDQFE